MGRQINFWMTLEDEVEFLNILSKEDVLWTYRGLKFNEEPVLNELTNLKSTDIRQRLIFIRRFEKDLLEFEHLDGTTFAHHVESFTPWTRVATGASPAFEWDPCKRENGLIHSGRIYLDTSWYDKKQHLVHEKNPELIKWFDKLVSKVRKKGVKYRFNGQYLMPFANQLFIENSIIVK